MSVEEQYDQNSDLSIPSEKVDVGDKVIDEGRSNSVQQQHRGASGGLTNYNAGPGYMETMGDKSVANVLTVGNEILDTEENERYSLAFSNHNSVLTKSKK